VIEIKELAKERMILTKRLRDFFVESGFLEVETPIMTPIPGMEPYLTMNSMPEINSVEQMETFFQKVSA